MDSEKMKILEMISSGKISAEEGAKLLDALDSSGASNNQISEKKKLLRIKVTDLSTGKEEVQLNLPISFLNWGLKMGQHFSPDLKEKGVNLEEISRLIHEGAQGKIIDVHDEKGNKHVEISIE